MKLKKIVLATSLVLVFYGGVYVGTKTAKKKTLVNTLEYIQENPKKQELFIEQAINSNPNYSSETVEIISKLCLKHSKENPQVMKPFILDISNIGLKSDYKREVWDQLNKQEKWEIAKEVTQYKAGEIWEGVKDTTEDAYNKFKETKLYEKMGEAKEYVKEKGKEVYENIK
jgi:hypothetical protein